MNISKQKAKLHFTVLSLTFKQRLRLAAKKRFRRFNWTSFFLNASISSMSEPTARNIVRSLLKSGMGIGGMLLEGIGDTIRVSLAAEPEKEVEAGFNILRAVGFPVTGPEVITCPTCGRTQYPCTEIANEVEKRLQGYKKSIKVAVMGCIVNGPGEAREADIGIAGGKGEAVLFIHGKPIKKLTGDNILDQFMDEIYKL